MQSLETTSGDLETTSQFGTWKRLPGNECERVARGYSNCLRLRRLLEAAEGCLRGPQYHGKCSFYFNCYLFCITTKKPRPQTESCLFSDVVHCNKINKPFTFTFRLSENFPPELIDLKRSNAATFELVLVYLHVLTKTKYNCIAQSTVINISNLFSTLAIFYAIRIY